MNIRCAFCQTPYTLSRNEILFALQKIESEKLNHYDAHCPRCRRATQLPTQRLEMAMPNWHQAALDAASAPVADAPVAAPAQPLAVESTEKVVKKTAGKEKAAPKATARKAKPVAAKKTSSKPVAEKAK